MWLRRWVCGLTPSAERTLCCWCSAFSITMSLESFASDFTSASPGYWRTNSSRISFKLPISFLIYWKFTPKGKYSRFKPIRSSEGKKRKIITKKRKSSSSCNKKNSRILLRKIIFSQTTAITQTNNTINNNNNNHNHNNNNNNNHKNNNNHHNNNKNKKERKNSQSLKKRRNQMKRFAFRKGNAMLLVSLPFLPSTA